MAGWLWPGSPTRRRQVWAEAVSPEGLCRRRFPTAAGRRPRFPTSLTLQGCLGSWPPPELVTQSTGQACCASYHPIPESTHRLLCCILPAGSRSQVQPTLGGRDSASTFLWTDFKTRRGGRLGEARGEDRDGTMATGVSRCFCSRLQQKTPKPSSGARGDQVGRPQDRPGPQPCSARVPGALGLP